jgi:hypothetical protein
LVPDRSYSAVITNFVEEKIFESESHYVAQADLRLSRQSTTL